MLKNDETVLKCAVCGGKAEQKHHICYNPKIEIDICVNCHNRAHPEHGVGRGRGQQLKLIPNDYIEPFIHESIEEKPVYYPIFTRREYHSEKNWVYHTKTKELLWHMCCHNGCEFTTWTLYYSPIMEQFYLKCNNCGFDIRVGDINANSR